jgi:hypothetical protein
MRGSTNLARRRCAIWLSGVMPGLGPGIREGECAAVDRLSWMAGPKPGRERGRVAIAVASRRPAPHLPCH